MECVELCNLSANETIQVFWCIQNYSSMTFQVKGVSFQRNCGAASVGVLQDNLVLSTELIM